MERARNKSSANGGKGTTMTPRIMMSPKAMPNSEFDENIFNFSKNLSMVSLIKSLPGIIIS